VARALSAGSVRRSLRHVAAVLARARCVARAEQLARACGRGAAVVLAAAPSAVRDAELRGALRRLGAAVVLAAAPSAVGDAERRGALRRPAAPVVLAAAPSAVRDAELRVALSSLDAALLLAPPASAMRPAVRRATGLGRLVTAIELAALVPAVRDAVLRGASGRLGAAVVHAAAPSAVRAAVRSAARHRALVAGGVLASLAASVRDAKVVRPCELYAPLELAPAAHVHTARHLRSPPHPRAGVSAERCQCASCMTCPSFSQRVSDKGGLANRSRPCPESPGVDNTILP
jgi:hypothetical protein